MRKGAVGYVVAGVLMGPFLAVLDQTMVSVALPRMVAEVGGQAWYAWLKISYLFFSTMATVVVGRLVEILPRKPVVVGAFGVYVGGSVLCALTPMGHGGEGVSWAFWWLMGARALQGVGGGALFATAFATMAWFFPPRARSLWAGLIGAVFGIAAALGPPLGGLLTEKLGWRWTFWINLPLGLIGVALLIYAMPALPPAAQGRFDGWGAGLLTLGAGAWLIGLSTFGSQKPIPLPAGIALLLLGGIAFYLWLRVERRASSPLFDLSYLRLPSFRYAALAAFWFGPLFFGVITFLPLYLQKVLGQPPALSGRYLLILTAVSVGSTAWVGARVSRHGRYKPFLVGGSVGLSGVLGATAVFLPESVSGGVLAGGLALAGLTTGPMQALLGVVAQNDVPISRVGSVSSAVLFARQMGASWGLAAWNALYTYGLHQSGDIRIGLQAAFAGMAILSLILVLTLLLLPDHRLRRRHIEEELTA